MQLRNYTAQRGKALIFFLLAACCAALPAQAQDDAGQAEQAAEALFEGPFDDVEDFEDAAVKARERGVAEQTIIEAKVLYALMNSDADVARSLNETIAEKKADWTYEDGRLIQNERTLSALQAALQALVAMDAGNSDQFEKQVKQAFWLEPEMGPVLARWIQQQRVEEAMANLRVPMDTRLLGADGEERTLGGVMEGNKAVLLDFWASWCGPCMSLMPQLKEKAEKLNPQDIVVAGVNTESDPEIARNIRERFEIDTTWLVEPEDRALSRLLEIRSIPHMVLIDPEGKVVFSGHPMEDALNEALKKLGAKL